MKKITRKDARAARTGRVGSKNAAKGPEGPAADEHDYRRELVRQQYRFIGRHSAVKICTWTKKSLTGKGVCYKEKFYGIKSHRCCQISVTVNYCDQDCIFCWRKRHNEPFMDIDEPEDIIKNAITQQRLLLSGMGGNDKADRKMLKEAHDPRHFAISLTGETLYYPKLNGLIKAIEKRGMTSFVVTNGQLPDIMEGLEKPTQLYLSLDAPTKEIYKDVCRPMNRDYWERLQKSLSVLKKLREEKKTRTAIRITLVKGHNMVEPEAWARLVGRAKPMFLEVKGYMFVGASRQRLEMENMPYHEEVLSFAKEISERSSYRIIDEQPESRVVLMMEKDFKGRMMEFS